MPTHTLAFAAGIGFGLLIAYLARRHRGTSTMTITDSEGNSTTTRYRAITRRIPKAEYMAAKRDHNRNMEDQ